MLILTRRIGESLVINDNVTVSVLSKSGNQVKLGLTAPREVSIHRSEVLERIRETKQADVAQADEVDTES